MASAISIGARGGLYKKQPPTCSTQHPPKFRDRISFQNHQDGLNTTHTIIQPQSTGCGGNMSSSRNTMLIVSNLGGPGSYRSRERRGVVSQKETKFYSKVKHSRYPGAWISISEQPSSLENHTQDKSYDIYVCAVCCCCLLLCSCWPKKQIIVRSMSQRAGYSALFTQLKLFRKVSNDKPIEHGRIISAFRESVRKFSQEKNVVQPTQRLKCRSQRPKVLLFSFTWKPYYCYCYCYH